MRRSSRPRVSDGTLYIFILIVVALVIFSVLMGIFFIKGSPFSPVESDTNGDTPPDDVGDYPFRKDFVFSVPSSPDDDTLIISKDKIYASNAALVDISTGKIVASKGAEAMIYPASMTKVMTLIVVYENLKSDASLGEMITVTQEAYDRFTADGMSGYGFKVGETLSVKDLIFASILDSDGAACILLAEYIAGSEANFVKLMNQKVADMGLLEGDAENNPSTLFQNCTGIHHAYHYTTCRDMAAIMSYAMKNPFCAEVLTSYSHTPGSYFRNGEAHFYNDLLVDTLHLDTPKYALHPGAATIKAGKTGYTPEAKRCLVSYAIGDDNHVYIAVTAYSTLSRDAQHTDHFYIYNTYIK